MSGIDKAVLVVMIILGVRCLFRGFLKEVFSFAGIIGAFVIARVLCKPVGAMFGDGIQASVIGYAVVFVGIIVGASVASWFLRRAVKGSTIGSVDRVGGFALGVFQGAVLMGVILFAVDAAAGAVGKSPFENSSIAPHLINFIKLLSGIVFKK